MGINAVSLCLSERGLVHMIGRSSTISTEGPEYGSARVDGHPLWLGGSQVWYIYTRYVRRTGYGFFVHTKKAVHMKPYKLRQIEASVASPLAVLGHVACNLGEVGSRPIELSALLPVQ